jgi:predicted dinucleotide-binding enzyme
MRIGILGSGLMGGKLGTLFARAGHDVVFSYARSDQKLKRLAREARGNAQAHTSSGAETLAKRLPKARVVSAFNTVSLIRDVGFDPVDAGPLRIARYTEPLALLVAQLAYEGDGGPELAYRIERFAHP